MKQLSLDQKKWLKATHLIAAGVWVTTGLVMIVVHFMGEGLSTGNELHLLNRIIYHIDMKMLVPSAVICLLTGWMYSHFTKWGYFKHGWLIFKWIVTVLIIVLGTVFSEPWISQTVKISGELGLDALQNSEYQWYDNNHNILGACMTITLIVTIFISVFKPGKKKANK